MNKKKKGKDKHVKSINGLFDKSKKEEGTVDHIFFNCPLQPVSLYDILPSKIPKPTNMKSLLLINNKAFLKLLSKYVSVYKIKVLL
jgi:hypothetical protein